MDQFSDIVDLMHEMINELDDCLSRDYIVLDIQLGKKQFNFRKPLTPKEESFQYRQRHLFIKLFVQECFRKSINDILSTGHGYMAFNRFRDLLSIIPQQEDIQSPIAASAYEEIKLDAARKAIDLNYDAYQVKMQDPNDPALDMIYESEED